MVLAVLIIGGTLVIYQTHSRFYYRQQALMEQEQNLRSALYMIARDVRMAGDGLSVMGVSAAQIYVPEPSGKGGSWFAYPGNKPGEPPEKPGVRAIFGRDSDKGPDSLTVFRSETESSLAFGQLGENFNASDPRLVFANPIPEGSVASKDVIGLVNGKNALLLQAGSISPSSSTRQAIALGPRFKPGSSLPGGISFPAGSYVYNLRDVSLTTFFIDQNRNNLMARYHHLDSLDYDSPKDSAVILAPGIEDLQVRYVLNDQDPGQGFDGLSMGALENDEVVRQVNLGLVGISGARSPTAANQPISLFNHIPNAPKDGFPRSVVTSMVQLRNY
jgi:hypothetical protein